MLSGLGLIILGAIMLIQAPLGYFHCSWKSPWRYAAAGVAILLLGAGIVLFSILY